MTVFVLLVSGVVLLADGCSALQVYTREQLPMQWGQAQHNLVQAYEALKDWANVASCYANVFTVYPDYEKAYSTASWLYHELL